MMVFFDGCSIWALKPFFFGPWSLRVRNWQDITLGLQLLEEGMYVDEV